MGFGEATVRRRLADRRGSPWLRDTCGLMTTLGGLGHTMPYLVPDTWANAVLDRDRHRRRRVFFELWAIAFIRSRYMDTPVPAGVFQIVLGGAIRAGGRHSDRPRRSARP